MSSNLRIYITAISVTAFFAFIIVFVLVSCETSPSGDVVHAEAIDWIWGYEEMRSGAVRLWLRNDNMAGYCTGDPELIKLVKEHNGDKVKLVYTTQKWADDESPNFFGTTGCSSLLTGTTSTVPIFKATHIELLDSQE